MNNDKEVAEEILKVARDLIAAWGPKTERNLRDQLEKVREEWKKFLKLTSKAGNARSTMMWGPNFETTSRMLEVPGSVHTSPVWADVIHWKNT